MHRMCKIEEGDVEGARKLLKPLDREITRSGAPPGTACAALAMTLGRHCALHKLDPEQARIVFDEVYEAFRVRVSQ